LGISLSGQPVKHRHAASLGFPPGRRRARPHQTLAAALAITASFGSSPRRLLAAFLHRPSTVGLPRWGKDPLPPLFSLGFASPRPRTLAGAPEPRAAAAPPLRPPWPSPHPLDLFPVLPSLSPCWPYPEPRPEAPRRVSSGEPPPPPPRPTPPRRRSWPEPRWPSDPVLRSGLDPDRCAIQAVRARSDDLD
jgi:hypothetical protein